MKTLQQVTALFALSLWSISVVPAAARTTETVEDSRHFNGFYVRNQIGINPVSMKTHTTEDDSNFNDGALIGYRHQFFNYWVFAIEGSIGDQTGATRSQDHVFELNQIWGLAVSVGISFGGVLINQDPHDY